MLKLNHWNIKKMKKKKITQVFERAEFLNRKLYFNLYS